MGKFNGQISDTKAKSERIDQLFVNLEWATPLQKPAVGCKYDVSISKICKGWGIVFRNKLPEILDRITIAVKGNTVFFKKDPNGWTVSRRSGNKSGNVEKCGRGYVQINEKPGGINLSEFIGDYEIKFFEPLDIWYIQKSQNTGS